MKRTITFSLLILISVTAGCDGTSWNNPHKAEDAASNIGYASFSEPPKTLDPAKSYSSDEIRFTAQIYEPPLQYHYLKRPYSLVPLTATHMPKVTYYAADGKMLPAATDPSKVAYSVYDIQIQPGIMFAPHPAFAKNDAGQYRYHHLTVDKIDDKNELSDFKYTGTRELTAEDYVYQIKRLADPKLNSPIYGLMAKYIKGLDQLQALLPNVEEGYVDLRQYPLSGVKVIDRYRYQVTIKGKYPQFLYWLAMPFFAPIPWEADVFYGQEGMSANNLTFSWYPVGTGPYLLQENNPNRQMVLARNPSFRGELYPSEGDEQDRAAGYLDDAGKEMPFVDKFVFSLEKESIPRWNKFLQGYYDSSAISSDSFDQAIQIDQKGNAELTPELTAKEIRLQTTVSPTIFYLGFNMLDPVVGGQTEKARKLRQAISSAIDFNEFIAIFLNGRGIPAQGPLPPGIFGFVEAENPILQHDLEQAKQLLAEAGYPNGVDEKTGEPLVLNYDVTSASGPDDKARFDWYRKQFAKLGIQLNIRSTQYNRFQEKMRTGNAQIFSWGWHADYPDPENFLFLLYGPNGKVKFSGENAANYSNAEFDRLFDQMKAMDNTPERAEIIAKMTALVQQDAPWVWGFYPKDFSLHHKWSRPSKPNAIGNNTYKYHRMEPELRAKLQAQWNAPITWPLKTISLGMGFIILPVFVGYWRRQHKAKR